MGRATAGVPSERLLWVDLAKGICMLLVVLVHVTNKHYLFLDVPDVFKNAWDAASASFGPLRMPLFFLVSGMLAASATRRPWGRVFRRSIVRPYYLYGLWALISFGIYTAIGSEIDGESAASFPGVLRNLFLPTSSLWYLYALAVYFALAKIGVETNKGIAFGFSILLAVVASFWPLSVQVSLVANLVFFMAGAYGPEVFKAVAAKATSMKLLWASLAYVLVVALHAIGVTAVPGVRPLSSCVAVYAGIVIISVLSRYRPLAVAGAYIGRNTLSLYVLHIPLLALVSEFVPLTQVIVSSFVWAVYPLILVVILVAAALAVRWFVERIGGAWFFSLPVNKERFEGASVPTRKGNTRG